MLRSSSSSKEDLMTFILDELLGVNGRLEDNLIGVVTATGELGCMLASLWLFAGLSSWCWVVEILGLIEVFIRAMVQGLDTAAERLPSSSSIVGG
jgi:hypothetical protein